jgi:protein-disulfide isomerase
LVVATRQQQREHARAHRREAALRAGAARARRRRAWQLLTAAGIAAVVVVAAIVLGPGGSGGPAAPLAPSTAAGRVATMLAGVPQTGQLLGNPRAPVTLQYYGDLECPICSGFSAQTLPVLIRTDVRQGHLKIQYMSLETATPDRSTFLTQQAAAYATGRQGKAWDYIELFYLEQRQEGTNYATPAFLSGLAEQVPGLNIGRWQSERFDPALTAQVQAEQVSFSALHLPQATPTLIVRGPGGVRGVQAAATPAQMAALIAAVA